MKLPRMFRWILTAIALFVVLCFTAPQQAPVIAYKFTMLAMGAVVAYMIDRDLFCNAPADISIGERRDIVTAARLGCRAIVFLAVVVGITLGQ